MNSSKYFANLNTNLTRTVKSKTKLSLKKETDFDLSVHGKRSSMHLKPRGFVWSNIFRSNYSRKC